MNHTILIFSSMQQRKKAKISNHYNQVPHLTQDTTCESGKTQENITYKRANRLALSQQVTDYKAAMNILYSMTDTK